MSTLTPLASSFPLKPLKFIAPMRGEKVDAVPADGEYLGLEQLESWSGRLSGVELQQPPEGGANVFCEGDVLFGKLRPYLAKGWVAERSGYCTTESLVLAPLDVDARFVRYCLLTHEVISAVDGSAFGSKMPRADWGFIGSVRFPAPSRAEQERIANFLDDKTARIDALIAEKMELLERLLEYRQSVATTAVTEGLPGEHVNYTQHVFLGRIPTSWKAGKFRHYVQFRSGQVDPEDETYSAMPLIAPNHVESGTGRLLEVVTAREQAAESGKYWCDSGDVIYSKIRPALRKATVAPFDCLCSADMYPLKGQAGLTNSFLFWFLLSEPFSIFAVQESARVAMPKLNRDTLADAFVPLPTPEEQCRIVAYVENKVRSIDLVIEHAKGHLISLREYRSSLISAAVTGQLDIGTVEGVHRRLLENALPA